MDSIIITSMCFHDPNKPPIISFLNFSIIIILCDWWECQSKTANYLHINPHIKYFPIWSRPFLPSVCRIFCTTSPMENGQNEWVCVCFHGFFTFNFNQKKTITSTFNWTSIYPLAADDFDWEFLHHVWTWVASKHLWRYCYSAEVLSDAGLRE